MSSASMSYGRPTRVVIPTVSQLLARLTQGLIGLLRRVDQWQLQRLQAEPRTPEEVLAWADRIERQEPGFAADLRAAALRALDQAPAGR